MAGEHTLVYDIVQQLAQPEDANLDRYRIDVVDVVDVGRTFDASESDWYNVTLFDGSAARITNWRELDSQTPICQHLSMKKSASSFKLSANAPDGRKAISYQQKT